MDTVAYSSSGLSSDYFESQQSCAKLFIFGSASLVLYKACIKPAWASSSAQLSYTAHKLLLANTCSSMYQCKLASWLPPACTAILSCGNVLQQSATNRHLAVSLHLSILWNPDWLPPPCLFKSYFWPLDGLLWQILHQIELFSTFYPVGPVQLSMMSCCWSLSFSSQTPQTKILCLTNEAYALRNKATISTMSTIRANKKEGEQLCSRLKSRFIKLTFQLFQRASSCSKSCPALSVNVNIQLHSPFPLSLLYQR